MIVLFPFKAMRICKVMGGKFVVIIWLAGFLLWWPFPIFQRKISIKLVFGEVITCTSSLFSNGTWQFYYRQWGLFYMTYLAALLIIMVSNVLIISKLWSSSKMRSENMSNYDSKSEARSTKILITISAFYLLILIPFIVIQGVQNIKWDVLCLFNYYTYNIEQRDLQLLE